jgi:tRNA threonylcarbamoyladenosine biosynthesis protein TsaE
MSFFLPTEIVFPNESRTADFARGLAPLLGAGDTLLLSGPIGAGKSHFARSLIHRLLQDAGVDEDIPSPTFTLIQTYRAGDLEIWHSDLYRLTDPQEVIELGLDEAFDSALCLVEWPERLEGLAPAGALGMRFASGGTVDSRRVTFASNDPAWIVRLGPYLAQWSTETCDS